MSGKSLLSARSIEAADLVGPVSERLQAFVRANHRLEKEAVFDLLYNPRRRATLRLLLQRDRPHSMDELVERIAAEENDVPVGELTRQQRRRVHVSLYQTHLPLLDDVDAIEYDRQANRIGPGPCMDELAPYLDTPAATTIPWRTYYGRLLLGYACLGGISLAGLIGTPSLFTLTLAISVLFLVLALAQGFY